MARHALSAEGFHPCLQSDSAVLTLVNFFASSSRLTTGLLAFTLSSFPFILSAQPTQSASGATEALSFEQARSRLLEVSDALMASEANTDGKRDLRQASRS